MEKKPNKISANVKKYRLLNHMTQEEVSELLVMDPQYYAQLERGERNFSIDKLIKLCSIFNIGIENLIPVEEPVDTELVEKIEEQMEGLNQKQLNLLYRFITEVLPFVK